MKELLWIAGAFVVAIMASAIYWLAETTGGEDSETELQSEQPLVPGAGSADHRELQEWDDLT